VAAGHFEYTAGTLEKIQTGDKIGSPIPKMIVPATRFFVAKNKKVHKTGRRSSKFAFDRLPGNRFSK